MRWSVIRGLRRSRAVRWAAVAALFGGAAIVTPSFVGLLWAALIGGLLLLMAIADLKGLRVPNAQVYPALGLALLAPAFVGREQMLLAASGGIVGLALMLMFTLVGRGSMGMADVKVGALCGLILGPNLILGAITGASVGAATVALGLLITRRASLRAAMPLVPFLTVATVLLMVNGGAVVLYR